MKVTNFHMNRKEYTYFYTHKDEAPKGFWFWRNEAVKYFNLQPGEVIHHLMETEEQKIFNKNYYERWGFDLDGNMRYAIKMTKEEHDNYHSSLRKGKHNSKEHNQHVSESLKKFYQTPEGKLSQQKSRKGQWSREGAHEKQSEAIKKYFSNEENRKKLSETMKEFSFWTDGEHTVYQKECPEGWHKGQGTLKVNGEKREKNHPKFISRRLYSGKLLKCVETGELFDIYEPNFRKSKKVPGHAIDAANGIRNKAGGLHWVWVDEKEV